MNPPTLEEAGTRGLLTERDKGIHTFSNGDHYDGWASGNCNACRFWHPADAGAYCAFEAAAFLGLVSPELASLFGWTQCTTEYGPRSGWEPPQQCRFFRDRERGEDGEALPPPPPADPLQLNLLADPTEDAAAFVSLELVDEPSRVTVPR